MRVWLQGESKEFRSLLGAKLPDGALLTHAPPADVILHWLQPLETLELLMPRLRDQISEEGVVWIVIPSRAERERKALLLTHEEIVAAALPAGLVTNKTLELNEKEEALRFALPREKGAKRRKA